MKTKKVKKSAEEQLNTVNEIKAKLEKGEKLNFAERNILNIEKTRIFKAKRKENK